MSHIKFAMIISKTLVVISLLHIAQCLPEQGVWAVKMSNDHRTFAFPKILFNDSTVYLKITCKSAANHTLRIKVGWALRYSPCADEYTRVSETQAGEYLAHPEEPRTSENIDPQFRSNKRLRNKTYRCNGLPISLKRPVVTTASPEGSTDNIDKYKVANTWMDGAYLFVVSIHAITSLPNEPAYAIQNGVPKFEGQVTVWMKSSYGYLSAMELPFRTFFGAMCLVYLGFALLWVALCASYWRYLHALQIWIGATILFCMLEAALYHAEYQAINMKGRSARGAALLTELISCASSTCARVLILLVSFGYGIAKPQVGSVQARVAALGSFYFVFALAERCVRLPRPSYDVTGIVLVAQVPVALVDVVILCWIVPSLLRLRKAVKFHLYEYFSDILVLVMGAAFVYTGWSIYYHRWHTCRTHWREFWVDEAFYQILFSVVLLDIIWLGRPINNHRYAYLPTDLPLSMNEKVAQECDNCLER